jgi:hypothetical protein
MCERTADQVMREFCGTRIPQTTALFGGRGREED